MVLTYIFYILGGLSTLFGLISFFIETDEIELKYKVIITLFGVIVIASTYGTGLSSDNSTISSSVQEDTTLVSPTPASYPETAPVLPSETIPVPPVDTTPGRIATLSESTNKPVTILDGDMESEPNNDTSSANKINVNTKYTGNLESDNDVDYYVFTIESKGKTNLSFEHSKIDSGNRFWEIYILSSKDDSVITRLYSNGREATLNSDYARIPPGTYYVKVNRSSYSNVDYSFIVNFMKENEFFESEPNNGFEEANKINLNTKYIGNLQSDNDADYYAFTVESKGKTNISFEHSKIDSGNRFWEIYILSSKDDSIIIRLYSNGREATLNSDYARIPPGAYYVKVNRSSYSNVDYSFVVNFIEENDFFESEPNNGFEEANKINLDTKYTGNLQSDNDVDYYEFTVVSKGEINISFEHSKIDSGNRFWEVYILSSEDDSVVDKLYVTGNEVSLLLKVENLEQGIYYLKVNRSSYSNIDYSFMIS